MNSLDLHLPGEVVLPYELYQGKVQEKFQQLQSEFRYPLGAADFVKRLKEAEVCPVVYKRLSDLCPTLGDFIARVPPYPFGSTKIIQGEKRLWDFVGKCPIQDGVVHISERQYLSLEGFLISGVAMRTISTTPPQKLEEEIFSYLGLENDQSKGRSICLPKVRDYPFLTLLAFSNGGKVLGSSRLDENGSLIGVR